jgi:predicted nucleotidyltransferase
MTLNISGNNLSNPYLRTLLEDLKSFFDSMEIKFFIIGATARDMILDAHNVKSGRATHDLDIAIGISDWEKYTFIESGLTKMDFFEKDKNQKQRFIYKKFFQLDIVPYGNIMTLDDKILWPPDEHFAMSVLGFSEVNESTIEIVIDEKLKLNIASLAGVFVLKITAWMDRNYKGNKDADDIGFILSNYLTIYEEDALNENYDIYSDEEFSIHKAGAILLGRDIKKIFINHPKSLIKIEDILQKEIDKQEYSRLINQIIETNHVFKYEETLKCLQNIVEELKSVGNIET